MASAPLPRLPWIDHLRTAIIALVINLHACVSYSHVGDWYFMSDFEPSLAAKLPFIVWQGHLQAFFMGLLFFISGYFAHGSITRRGPGQFTRERLLRLGLPALFYMLAVHPFILLALNPWHAEFGPPGAFYLNYLASGRFLGSSGPLWFVVALLILSLVLASSVSRRRPRVDGGQGTSDGTDGPPSAGPNGATLGVFAAVLGLATFGVRLVQPIGTSVLNLQLCYFVQYIAFFAVAVHAARHGWLAPLASSSRARVAGWLALIGGPLVLLALLIAGIKDAGVEQFLGGWHWQALGLALWEQFAGVGLSLGALALFSRHANNESPRLRWLSERSFAVYVLHAPVLVALAMLFRALPQNLYFLVALLTLTGIFLSYLVADVVRRLPVLRSML